MEVKHAPLNCQCKGKYFTKVFSYDAPPEGEIRFKFNSTAQYRRDVFRCKLCGHFVSTHQMDMSMLYSGDYVSSTYADGGIKKAFQRIISLDESKSDNAGRVRRVLEFAASHFPPFSFTDKRLSILDVGSGLCVFLYKMKEVGWECTALDVDPRLVEHAKEVVAVKAICGDLMSVKGLGKFDVITFNKVLEHVEDSVSLLAKSAEFLHNDGFVYIELPDGEAAVHDGPKREEFFIDHFHVFSVTSLAMLSERSGFTVRIIERLREPSGKYTLCAFLCL